MSRIGSAQRRSQALNRDCDKAEEKLERKGVRQRASSQIKHLHETARFEVRALTPRSPRPLRAGNTTATVTLHTARYGYAAPPWQHHATAVAPQWPRSTE